MARELRRLERLGLISPWEVEKEAPLDVELLPDPVVEIDLRDEDLAPVEAWEPEPEGAGDSFVLGELGEDATDAPFAASGWEIVVTGRTCSVLIPAWMEHRKALSAAAAPWLNELDLRFRTLRAIAGWLNERRSAFLESRDFWDLGPADYDELRSKEVPVVQQRFLKLLRLGPAVREDSFSRYLTNCDLVWPNGHAPVQVLFSADARLAWVARAVVLFVKAQNEELVADVLESHSTLSVRKGSAKRSQLLGQSVESMDLETFIEFANLAAGTCWQKVLRTYRERMVKDG